MKQTRILMGLPITVEIIDQQVKDSDIDRIYDYFQTVDDRYSTYKKDSEITKINNGLARSKWSQEMKDMLEMCRQTKEITDGYFDIEQGGKLDPSGLVKGWAINNAAKLISRMGFENYYVEAGGDIQTSGRNSKHRFWRVGIRNPFNRQENVKIIDINNKGVATSGTYIRGRHIYNPKTNKPADDIASMTVVGANIYDADRFATAAFAMGENGINFIESLDGYEAYMINKNKTAIMTSGFERFVAQI
jgi:thiamine biosynthesis lipoprotein